MPNVKFEARVGGYVRGVANTPADLPAAPFRGLALLDLARVLNPPGLWQLAPMATVLVIDGPDASPAQIKDPNNWEWVDLAAASGPPSGPAGGDLAGTYPNPSVIDFTLTENADAGGFRIENLGAPNSPDDAARLADITAAVDVPSNVDLYVNAATGNDANDGSILAPLATINEAVERMTRTRWIGYAHINVSADTYTLSGVNLMIPGSGGVGTEPLAIVGTMVDSGLGARAIAASTAGSGSTFGTVQDSVGGLVANAYQGMFIRLTGAGTHVGKRFLIAANTATTFTVAGLFVAVTTETFVVEQPGTVVRFATSGALRIFALYGADLVTQHVRFDGQLATSIMLVRNSTYLSACQIVDVSASINADRGGQLQTQSSSSSNNPAPSVAPLATVGVYVSTAVAGAGASELTTQGGQGTFNLANSVVRVRSRFLVAGAYGLFTSCWFENNGAIYGQNGGSIFVNTSRFETVTAFVGTYENGTIVLENGCPATIQSSAFINGTGAVLVAYHGCSPLFFANTGSGNAGVPVRIRVRSGLSRAGTNSVTGAVAGQDVQIGARAAPDAWAAVNAARIYDDQVVGTNEYCVAGP